MLSLFTATTREDVDIAINNGADVNYINYESTSITALNLACESENWDIAEYLLDKGADYTIFNNAGNSPLHIAAYKGNLRMIKILVSKGADPNKINPFLHLSPLCFAISKGYIDIVQFLLSLNVKFNIWSENRLVLLMACDLGNVDCLKMLIDAGINVNCTENIIIDIIKMNHIDNEIFIQVIDHLVIAGLTMEKLSDSLVEVASHESRMLIGKKLLNLGCDINHQNAKGRTPLINAILANNMSMIDYLVKNGADINLSDYNGETPLMFAVKVAKTESETEPDTEILEFLINNGANLNLIDYKGETALIKAVKHKKFLGVLLLIKYNPDIDIIDKSGKTAHMWINDFIIETTENLENFTETKNNDK